jgi:hypothetical protein
MKQEIQVNSEKSADVRELASEEIDAVAGARINLRTDIPRHAPQEPTGGAGTTDLILHYTLTVIE